MGDVAKVRLTKKQHIVLKSIIAPNKDDDPFPSMNTIKALILRGLVKMVDIDEPRTAFEMLMRSYIFRIEPTDAGRAVLAEVERNLP